MQKESCSNSPKVFYEKACAIVRLFGEVNNQTIFELCDEIDLAIDYYNYRKIEIQIDSPGGSIQSLDYFITKLEKWRQKEGVIIATLGLTNVASAAAMILALGTVGYRRAYRSSSLLFHNSRVITNGSSVFTKETLNKANKDLAEIDERLLDRLSNHIHSNKVIQNDKVVHKKMWGLQFDVEKKSYQEYELSEESAGVSVITLKKEYVKLHNLDVYISPGLAGKMLLIDFYQEDFESKGFEKRFKED